MSSPTDYSSQKSLWPVYAFGAFIAAGILLAALGLRTCL